MNWSCKTNHYYLLPFLAVTFFYVSIVLVEAKDMEELIGFIEEDNTLKEKLDAIKAFDQEKVHRIAVPRER